MSNFLDIIKSKSTEPKVDPNQLTAAEIQLMLFLLKQSTIKGDQVETFYNAVVKLQNQFLSLNVNQK